MFRKIGFACALLLAPVVVFATCERCGTKEEKVHVQLKDLIFDSDSIWFRCGTDVQEAEAVFVDALGYCVAKKKKEKEQPEPWTCPKCGYTNTRHRAWGCANCDWPYDDDFFSKRS